MSLSNLRICLIEKDSSLKSGVIGSGHFWGHHTLGETCQYGAVLKSVDKTTNLGSFIHTFFVDTKCHKVAVLWPCRQTARPWQF